MAQQQQQTNEIQVSERETYKKGERETARRQCETARLELER